MAADSRSTSHLDPDDVSVDAWLVSGPEQSAQQSGIRLLHRPTGTEVSGELPPGPLKPSDKRRLQAELQRRLWRDLEVKVARRSE